MQPAKGSGKQKSKAKKPTRPKKVINQKKNSKPTDLLQDGLTLSNTTSSILECTSCQSNYTSFIIGSKSKCLKFGNQGLLSSAVSTCAKDGARPPLPKSTKENDDFLDYFLSKKDRKINEFALDLSDAKVEGYFISSTGQKDNFTNWALNEPYNKTDEHDFVTMWYDGKWNVNDGNYTSGVIICEMDCPLCKYSNSLIILTGKDTKNAVNKK